MDTSALFQFCLLNTDFQIVTAEDGVYIEISKMGSDRIKLALPVPYNRDSEQTGSSTYDTWDNLSLYFRILELQDKRVTIEVTINEQEGYWYYGSLDDSVPPVITTKRKLIVDCEEVDTPISGLNRCKVEVQ